MWQKEFSLLLLTIFSSPIWCFRKEQQHCITPEGFDGLCVSLPECPSIAKYYNRNQNSRQAVQYLGQIHQSCSIGDPFNAISVCCEEAYRKYHNLYPIVKQISIKTQISSCVGPDLRPGNCMNILDCDEIIDFIFKAPLDGTISKHIHSNNEICRNKGFYHGTSVCCPIKQTKFAKQIGVLNEPLCGYSEGVSNFKAMGGQPAEQGSWPWLALLGYDVLYGSPFKCGGSLISERHVLTAAHCIKRDLRFVRLGEHDLRTYSESRSVDINIIRTDSHPNYNTRTGKNNIAVLHLETPVSFQINHIIPICLPKYPLIRTNSLVNHLSYVAGWGTEKGGRYTGYLQQLMVPILHNKVCRDKYVMEGDRITWDQFDEAVICAGRLNGGKDSCYGDAGGPLMYQQQEGDQTRFYVIGVASYGFICDRSDMPTVYSNVADFIEWIEDKVAC